MDATSPKKEIKTGRYKHFKGKDYDVYCKAFDCKGNQFVLYRQNYGDKSFWLRPLDMFLESVIDADGKLVPRFSFVRARNTSVEKRIKELIQLIQKQTIRIRHSEDEVYYYITCINDSSDCVRVHPAENQFTSGYLTDFEIAERMGIISCIINDTVYYYRHDGLVREEKTLRIGNNEVDTLSNLINPCSIDLQIADSGFLQTKNRLVDPQAIEHVSSANELWKSVKQFRSKNQSSEFIKLYPRRTILTHTKERIRIPKDCAGKVEIKSTYARLSLSITSGDFCNPGYDGYFPLEITNNGKHTIIIHSGETMAQLMLIPLNGPILEDYSTKATFMNESGFDDGTPYTFWRERSIKNLRKKSGTQSLIDLYQKILKTINSSNTEDVNEFRDRFENNFLSFCQKHTGKEKYQNRDTKLPDSAKILNAYVKKEKRLKNLFSIKWISGPLAVIAFLEPIIKNFFGSEQTDENTLSFIEYLAVLVKRWPWFLAAGCLLALTILLIIRKPKIFCTFEGIDLRRLE